MFSSNIANSATMSANAGFLYPFLGQEKQQTNDLLSEVAASIMMKVQDDSRLRLQVAREQAEQIGNAAIAIHERLAKGGKLILFGNGGSATDANDWAIDCVLPPSGYRPIPAVSLSMEPANITAVANDVGTEVVFLRQLIAQAQPEDVAIGISTSGGSRNIIVALEEARKRNMLTVALLGYDGGEIRRRQLADFPLIVQCDYIPRIQEVQASIYHIIREILEVLQPWPSLSFSAQRGARIPRRCENGWSGSAASSLSMTLNSTEPPCAACASSQMGNAACPCWWKMARWFKPAGRDAVASWMWSKDMEEECRARVPFEFAGWCKASAFVPSCIASPAPIPSPDGY